jgi:hypothetical protein
LGHHKFVVLSDVTLGYGTPQLPLLTSSIAALYNAHPFVIEPAAPDMPPRHHRFPSFRIERIQTVPHPHSELGRNEYLWRAAALLNELEPDILLVTCTYSAPALFLLKKRPRLVIYFSLESVSFYGQFDLRMNPHLGPLFDVVIYSEENRAAREIAAFHFGEQEKVVMYNCGSRLADIRTPLPFSQRNGKLLHAGTIGPQTFSQYFADPRTAGLPIDVFGPIRPATDTERQNWLNKLAGGSVKYHGFIPSDELALLRPAYLYSIVVWDPARSVDQNLYAAPNKMFEAIADGVPPICGPHPQCELILERYGCGLLMPDWTYEGFIGTLRRALRMRGTPGWQQMVDNCVRASNAELNWEAQFANVSRCLVRRLAPEAVTA